ncbi:MAG: MFS transporter [Chromatiales bacterium]|nr:MFS transporter [Chromatiales bacterium]
MSPTERRATFTLGSIYALRMLGLFMILPVFALYAENLEGVTPLLVGVAISAYGLTQALLQIPFGMMSDRLGRKPVIIGGLVLFAAGSVVAATAESIHWVIVGRALQGSGAIAAAIMALAADLTREEQRTKIMAFIGASIGAAFVIAMVGGPLLNTWIGVDGIFWLTAVLALLGIAVVAFAVPTPAHSGLHRDAEPVPAQFASVLRNPDLLRLDLGILTLHTILTAGFVVLPLVLRDQVGLSPDKHWMLYLPVMLLGLVAMIPMVIMAERQGRMKTVFLGAVGVLVVSQVWMSQALHSLWAIAVGLWIFFAAFNLLEATLPSLISKTAPPDSKGTAMGVYSSSQFLGAFLGGLMGGGLHGAFGESAVYAFCAGAGLIWLLLASGMRNPKPLKSVLLRVNVSGEGEARSLVSRLTQVSGVAEAVVVAEDGIAYLKVDSRNFDSADLAAFGAAEG